MLATSSLRATRRIGSTDRGRDRATARAGRGTFSSVALTQAELDLYEDKLRKRGFRRDDVLLHACPDCGAKSVLTYVIAGRSGGRDIRLCAECGRARSWRSVAGLESREEDPTFDLATFLR